MYLSSYDPRSQPLFYFKGYPVRLAMLLVVVHCAALVIAAICGNAATAFLGLAAARGLPGSPVNWPDWWQWGTYALNHAPSAWFLLDMYFLWRWGTELEATFGRKFFAVLYTVLWLLPPLVAALFLATGLAGGAVLAGTHYLHFCLFLSMVFLHPDAPFFGTPVKLWFVGLALFLIYLLRDLAVRYFLGCTVLTANAGATYWLMRRAGLSPRFTRVSEAIVSAMPQRKPSASRTKKYEPKVRPRPDITPDLAPVAKIDSILEKISRSGIDSLDEWERRELDRASTELKRLDP